MISLLIVNYRSADLAVQAIRSARGGTSDTLHVVVVDNSCDSAEAARLRPECDVLVVSATNAGYAAAINAGRPHCKGDVVVVANPDVIFFPRCIDLLVETLRIQNCAVAGPALYWDDDREWLLPPADSRTLAQKIDDVLGSRFAAWQRWLDRRRFRQRVRFWSLLAPTPVAAISGAVMAIRLDDFDDAGGFDERFQLYFEETDFLRRVRRAGRKVMYVPAAACRHLYNQSAGLERELAAARYAASEKAYYEKSYGFAATIISRLAHRRAAPDYEACSDSPFSLPRGGLVIEVSPLPEFATAAGHFPKGPTVSLPAAVTGTWRGDALYLRAVDPDTAVVVAACVRYAS